jgi:RNA polymerase sigma-70 factor, ECF subfamily
MIGQYLCNRGAALAIVIAIAAVGGALVASAYSQSNESGKTMQYNQPYWALRAHPLARIGRNEEARVAYEEAAGLSKDPAIQAFGLSRRPSEASARVCG